MKQIYFFLVFVCFLLTGTQMDAQTHFFDDAEEQTDFAIAGFYGWQAFDYDGKKPDGTFHSFPNKDQYYAFMVYNPSATNPVNTFDYWQPFSGSKYFVSFAKVEEYVTYPSDAWLVTPELDAPDGGTFSFQALRAASQYGEPAKFKVGYSTTDTDKNSFTFFGEKSLAPSPWKLYTYNIPANAKYIAIATVDVPGTKSGLCFDDLDFKANINNSAPAPVSQINFSLDQEGNKKISFSWVNPSKTMTGDDLTGLNKVFIYRGANRMDMQLTATLTDNVQPGSSMNYTDETIPNFGVYYYAIIAENSDGRGDYIFTRVYIGLENTPGAPNYLLFAPNDQYENLISWNAVTYGENGGALNGNVKGYTLKRTLGAVDTLLATYSPNTYFLETPAPELNLYTYSVYAQRTPEDAGIPFTENKYSGMTEGERGIGQEYKTGEGILMDYSYTSHLSQSIYYADQFDVAGIITSINWFGNITGTATSFPLKVYLSVTKRNNFALVEDMEQWIYFGDQTLVFDGEITLKTGGKSNRIAFDKGFYFDPSKGENLVVTVVRPKAGSSLNCNGKFYSTQTDSLRTYCLYGYTGDLSILTTQPPAWQSDLSFLVPNMVYRLDENFGKVGFRVKGGGLPVGDASIDIVPKNSSTISYYKGSTDAETGELADIFLLSGEYEVTVIKEGYLPQTIEFEVTKNMDEIMEITLSSDFPQTLSGTIRTSGQTPVENATVTISGYSTAEAKTDEQGQFEVSIFQEQNYHLEVTHPLYDTYNTSFISEKADEIEWEEPIILDLYPHAPYNITAGLDKATSIAEIKWNRPVGLLDNNRLQWGSGINSTSWGAGGTEFAAAVKFDVTDLDNYQGGSYYITHIKAFISNHADIALEIYEVEAGNTPQLIYVQNEKIDEEDWYNFELNNPVAVKPDRDIYLAVRFFRGYGAYPAGLDDGPCITGKGHLINEGNGWRTIGLTNKNWCIYGSITRIIDASPSSYTVSRGLSGSEEDVETWIVLGENQTELIYSDDLSDLSPDVYRYAVKAAYPNGEHSGWKFSNEISFLMDFEVNLTLMNEELTAGEVFAALYGREENKGYQEAKLMGTQYTFPKVERGAYQLKVWATNFNTWVSEEFELTSDTSLNVAMEEFLCPPAELRAEKNAGGSIDLFWDLAGEYKEEFETFPDFEKSVIGDFVLRDMDELPTFTFTHFSYPGQGSAMAYVIFNPYATFPPLQDANPYEGRRYLANFGEEGTADDWIIIPARGGNVSFYARSIVSATLENFSLMYSTTDTEISSFVPVSAETQPTAPVQWTKFEYTVPAGTKYIAVRNTTVEGYIMLMDNLVYQKPFNHALGYDIYLNEIKIASDVTGLSYRMDHLPEGENHTVGVVAKYAGGNSEMTTIDLKLTGIDDNPSPKGKIIVYPNPSSDGIFKIDLPGNREYSVKIYNSLGREVYSGRGCVSSCKVSLQNESAGIYIMELNDGLHTERIKIIIR
ncbi:MAG: choice-of-anchor J domain-containing protein [Dysgonamonadaceae bacterium]|jgi:hypothetical protein|nr:choice-of-anchor J domain-containing protein [Dysgonamonadaceae bacterium]